MSAIESVPLTINPAVLPLVKEFGGAEYERDTAIADALLGKVFYSLIRCDFRGRLQHLCDFNYTRGDPVRALFLFADDKPVGDSIYWLEIAIANAYGEKGTWDGRLGWAARNRELIKAVAADPGLIWRGEIKAKEGFSSLPHARNMCLQTPMAPSTVHACRSGSMPRATACSIWR